MEPSYQPGFYCPERDQQENRQLQPSQQQQHVVPYHHLDIPYHTTSQHQTEFVVDQPLRAFPLHPGAQVMRSLFQDSGPVLGSPSIIHQARQQVPFTLGGHGVKSVELSANYATPISTPEPVEESNILAITAREQVSATNTAPQQDKTDHASDRPKQMQCEEQQAQCRISPPHHTASPQVPNKSASEPPLLAALNLKSRILTSSGPDLPQGLTFKRTSQNEIEGVVSKEKIDEGMEFGPYSGTLLDEDIGWFKETAWEVCISGRVFFYIDGRKTWMSHLRSAQNEEEQNIEAFQYYGEIYFRTTKVIEPGSELRVFYSEEYKSRIGIHTRLNDLKFSQGKFQCSQCEGLFTSAKLLLRHIRYEHTNDKPDEMIPVLTWKKKRKKQAETEVSPKQQPQKEKKVNSQEELAFKCGTCDKVFPSCGRLKAHMLFHEYNQEHTCPVCGKGQTNAQALEKHMLTHESKLHKCKKCTRKFKSETALGKHERKAHGYRCQFCFERFSRKNECLKHEQTHQAFKSSQSAAKETCAEKTEATELAPDEPKDMLGKTSNYYMKKRPFKCRFCSKRYISRCSARDHEKEAHTNEGSYKCIHCPRLFTSERRLIEHLISHEQKGFYRCTLCPRSFGSESALNNHQGEHTGLKPFKCEICGRGFRVKNHFHAHKRRMHQERPMRFFCSVCNKGFADKGNLTKHERRHKGIRQYVCLECGKGFTAGTSLATHMQTMHTEEKRFCCEICGKKFSLNNHYTHHMIKHKLQGDGDLQQ